MNVSLQWIRKTVFFIFQQFFLNSEKNNKNNSINDKDVIHVKDVVQVIQLAPFIMSPDKTNFGNTKRRIIEIRRNMN